MLKLVLCAGVELVLARLRRQVNTMKECRVMVKSTIFWSWLALSFSSGFVTPDYCSHESYFQVFHPHLGFMHECTKVMGHVSIIFLLF